MGETPAVPSVVEAFAQAQGLKITHHLPYGKFILQAQDEPTLYKISTPGMGQRLLRNEATGLKRLRPALISTFRVPESSITRDDDELTILRMEFLTGTTAPRGTASPKAIRTLTATMQTTSSLKALLEHLPLPKALTNTLETRHGNPQVPLAPSHGDYIYWNLLMDDQLPPGLVDFEYFDPMRMVGFDDLHYHMGPQFFWNMRHRIHPSITRLMLHRALRKLKVRLGLNLPIGLLRDLCLVHWRVIATQLHGDGTNRPANQRIVLCDRLLNKRM